MHLPVGSAHRRPRLRGRGCQATAGILAHSGTRSGLLTWFLRGRRRCSAYARRRHRHAHTCARAQTHTIHGAKHRRTVHAGVGQLPDTCRRRMLWSYPPPRENDPRGRVAKKRGRATRHGVGVGTKGGAFWLPCLKQARTVHTRGGPHRVMPMHLPCRAVPVSTSASAAVPVPVLCLRICARASGVSTRARACV